MRKLFIVALWAAFACTQFTSELVTIHKVDGTTEQVVVEREEYGTLFVDQITGKTEFVKKSKKE